MGWYVLKRRPLLLACSWLIALASIQCGCGTDRAQPDGSTVTVLYPGDEWVLGPEWDMDAKLALFLPLVTYDATGRPQGRLAESWEHSADYRQWTFHLRQDVRWHDGVPVTAHDVMFTMELNAHPDVLSTNTNLWRAMQSFAVLDDFTFTMTFTKPTDALDAWGVYYPKHLLENLDPADFHRWAFWTQPVGNGAYRYVRHVPKTMMEFEANPDFYGGTPQIDRMVLKFGGSSQLTELRSGNVDAVVDFDSRNLPALTGDPRFRVHHAVNYRWTAAIYWNHGHPLFRDLAVRQALTMAINRRELHRVLNLPDDMPLFDVMFTRRQYLQGQLGEPLPYDPERAGQLLDAAGWRDQDGDGIRERSGRQARFTAIALTGGEWPLQPAAVYVQQQLRRVGVQMEVGGLEFGVVRGRVRTGDFDAAFYRFPNWTEENHVFGENSPIGYTNPEVVELFKRAEETGDPEARDRVYDELMGIFRADLPLTFLFAQVWTIIADRRIGGITPAREDPAGFMEYLWLEDANR